MPSNTGFKRRIKTVNVIGEDGAMAYPDVIITPDSDNVIVLSPNPSGSSAPLHDFLFRKFKYDTIEGAPVRYPETKQQTTTDENGNEHTETVASYFQVSPISKSIWQSWYDYQDITKKRLVGFYKTEGETSEYVADFLLGREDDLQSIYTLELPDVDADANMNAIKDAFDLRDKSTDNVDYKIPSDVEFNEDGNINWSTFDDKYRYSEDDKAKELMLSFGNKSLWQAIMENEQKRKDRLIGIYKDGQLVGHFEATKYNLEVLKEVYKDGVPVVTWDDDPDQQIYAGYVGSDKEAMDLLVDLENKSVY